MVYVALNVHLLTDFVFLCSFHTGLIPRLHISHSEDPLPIIETIAGTAAPELMSEDVQHSALYPTLSR